MVIIAIPLLVLAFLGIRRHYRKIARRLRAGTAAVRSAGAPRNQVLIVADAVDVATESALWYAQRIAPRRGPGVACSRPRRGRRNPAPLVQARRTGPRARGARPAKDASTPFSRSCGSFLVANETSSPSSSRSSSVAPRLLAAVRRTAFRLKLRLLSEPGVVVADVPAISDKHGPDGGSRRSWSRGSWSQTSTPPRCGP